MKNHNCATKSIIKRYLNLLRNYNGNSVTYYSQFKVNTPFALMPKPKCYSSFSAVTLFEKYGVDCKTVVGFFLKISKEIGKAWRKSITCAKRASLTRP